MLVEMSCWNWDAFGAIGAWLGGLGAAGAAITAIWMVKREDYRRKEFSKSLFHSDIKKLNQINFRLTLILKEYRSNANYKDDKKKIINSHWRVFSSLVNGFEFFGHSGNQFYFTPSGSEFTKLQDVVIRLQMQNIWGQVHEEIMNGSFADINVETLIKELEEALKK